MRIANYHYLDRLVGPLNTVTDEEGSSIISRHDENGIRKLIRRLIIPEFASLDDHSPAACKDALRYFLTTGRAPFHDILEQQQEWPVEPPTDPSQFFFWVWKELFPSEDHRLSDTTSWGNVTTQTRRELRAVRNDGASRDAFKQSRLTLKRSKKPLAASFETARGVEMNPAIPTFAYVRR